MAKSQSPVYGGEGKLMSLNSEKGRRAVFLIQVDARAIDRRRNTTSGLSGEDADSMYVYRGSFLFGVRRMGKFKLMT